jgi:hypothetical protein
MATVKVVELIAKAQTVLQDTTSTRWPPLELQGWLNDSYREILLIRPDINTKTGTFTCATGTRQVITTGFANALRLIDVVRNVASASTKEAIRVVDRRVLDDQRRGWHAETGTVNIQHFMFDPRLPKEFLVYPPATTSTQLEIVYSEVPTAHTLSELQLTNPATTEVIKIDDSYANAMLDYMLYRAYSKDAEYAANANRAVAHYQAMQTALGVKTQTDNALGPMPRTGPQQQV